MQKSHILFAVIISSTFLFSSSQGLADNPSNRWQQWRALQVAKPADQVLPRFAWAFFGDGGITATDADFATYAQAGFTFVQAKLSPTMTASAEKAGLHVILGTWDKATENKTKLNQILAQANSDENVSAIILRDEPELPDLAALGTANAAIYSSTPARVLPLQTVLPAHTSKPGNKKRFDPTKKCEQPTSYCDFVTKVITQAKPAAILATLYPLLETEDRHEYYNELETLRKHAQNYHIGMLGFVILSPHFDGWSGQRYKQPTAADIRWQVYSLLANNAKGIAYYNYRVKTTDHQPDHGAFADGMIASATGQPTDTYKYVKDVNCQLAALGSTLMKIDVRDTFLPETNKAGFFQVQTPTGVVKITGQNMLVSTLESEQGYGPSYLMIVNTNHRAPEKAIDVSLQLSRGVKVARVQGDVSCSAQRAPLTTAGPLPKLTLAAGEGALIELTK